MRRNNVCLKSFFFGGMSSHGIVQDWSQVALLLIETSFELDTLQYDQGPRFNIRSSPHHEPRIRTRRQGYVVSTYSKRWCALLPWENLLDNFLKWSTCRVQVSRARPIFLWFDRSSCYCSITTREQLYTRTWEAVIWKSVLKTVTALGCSCCGKKLERKGEWNDITLSRRKSMLVVHEWQHYRFW